MSALAREVGALNLSQGFPDFPVDPELIERVNKAMQRGANQYAPLAGVPALLEVLAQKSTEQYGSQYDPAEEITITAGATQALSSALATVLQEGDEVILFTPAYDSYVPIIELHGGRAVSVQLSEPDYRIDWELVKKVVNHRTRMIILNTPHNPTGQVLYAEDLVALEEIADNSSIILLSDEVYEHILLSEEKHWSLRLSPALRQRSFIVGSLGKSFHCTGWKVGYIMAPAYLMREFRKVHQYQVFCVNRPMQEALAEHLLHTDLNSIAHFYQAKQKRFAEAMAQTPFKALPTYGSYFQLMDYSAISEENDLVFAERLAREHKVAAIPLSPFYRLPVRSRVLRFCFAKEDATLDEAARRLAKLS